MTRKHFQLIANTFRSTKPVESRTHEYNQWVRDVYKMADALATTNDKFDTLKFIEWCKK